jgi:hypothetical protein
VATLLVLASILIGFVSVFALRSFLTDRLDAQLAYALERSQAAVNPPADNQNSPGRDDSGNNGNGNNGRDNNGNGNDRNDNNDGRGGVAKAAAKPTSGRGEKAVLSERKNN